MQNDSVEDIEKYTKEEQEYFQDEAWKEVEHAKIWKKFWDMQRSPWDLLSK